MAKPAMDISYDELCTLLGEKDVIIYQLGKQFNALAEEHAQLEKKIKELQDGRLEQPTNNDPV